MNKPICTVMVGLPATGKSHRANQMTHMDPDLFVYSTDNILERIADHLGKTYNDVFADHIKSAQTEADIWLAEAMKNKLDIVWDQTNLGVGKRKKIINRMKNAGYSVECVCILPPEASHLDDQLTWKHRLDNRPGKSIPQHVLSNMMDSYVQPKIEEGFDAVHFFDMHGSYIGIEHAEN